MSIPSSYTCAAISKTQSKSNNLVEILTWISIQLEKFSHQLFELSADFTHCGARCHRQMVQPRILQSHTLTSVIPEGHDINTRPSQCIFTFLLSTGSGLMINFTFKLRISIIRLCFANSDQLMYGNTKGIRLYQMYESIYICCVKPTMSGRSFTEKSIELVQISFLVC